MVTSQQALKKYGEPTLERGMVVWDVPSNLEIGVIPKKVYCNRDMVQPLTVAFTNLIQRGHVNELKTWDGCFMLRTKRGLTSMSLHSWAIACDVNQEENQLNMVPKLSPQFVKCFTDAGCEWGGTWTRKDGMHFQLAVLP